MEILDERTQAAIDRDLALRLAKTYEDNTREHSVHHRAHRVHRPLGDRRSSSGRATDGSIVSDEPHPPPPREPRRPRSLREPEHELWYPRSLPSPAPHQRF